jgi:flavodoxin
MNHPSIVLCKSIHHGNTLAVAQRIARCLEAQVVDPETAPAIGPDSYELIGVGSGIYYGRFHRAIRDWLAKLPPRAGRGTDVFIYSTSGLPFLSPFYHRGLKRGLEQRGFRVVGEFYCRGHDTFGPLRFIGGLNRKHPDAADLERADAFASRLRQELHHITPDPNEPMQQKASA